MNSSLSRRQFLKTSALAATAVTLGATFARAEGVHWPIGCFNRPWTQKLEGTPPGAKSFDLALKGVKEAGYETIGLLTPTPGEGFINTTSTPEYLTELKARIAASGLKANFGALHVKPSLPLKEAIADMHTQLDHAKFLGLEWVLTFGTDREKDYAQYYKMMADGTDYCQSNGMKLVMKPHGGSSASSEEIKRCIAQVNRPNFKVWYDAGNIIYYRGKDPVEELKPIVQYVTGFCAKDCARPKGDVFIQFGTGKVDFKGVFEVLKSAGFNGPIFVENSAGKTYAEVTEGARQNRLYLEKVLASL